MTAPEPGSARPARLAGLVLIGVAVIALILGVITLINGGKSNNNGAGQQPSSTSGPTSNRPGSSQAPPPKTTTNSPQTSTTQQPPPQTTTTTANPQPPQPPPNNRAVPVKVLNNSKITGLAARAATDFKADGWNVTFTGNYTPTSNAGNLPTSTALYRPGTPGEAAAKELAQKFGLVADTHIPPGSNTDPGNGVTVIVTNDYGSK
jgi:cytoskeletal protein RodZ